MEVVANHLHDQALLRAEQYERDLFGRSAFNRYYYATFIIVRDGLGTLSPKWGRGTVAHANFPSILRGEIRKVINDGYKKAKKIEDRQLVRQCSNALNAAEELAKLMEEARYARTTADYHPEVSVDFAGGDSFSLNAVSARTARAWPVKARAFLTSVSVAWKQVYENG